MKQFTVILASIWSLFVDDAVFAGLLVAWLAVIYLLALASFGSGWRATLLFGGIGLILMHGAWHKTRNGL